MRPNIDSTQPASEDYKISFDEYKLLIEWVNQLADRRQETSNLFFGVSGAIFTVLGITLTQLKDTERTMGVFLAAIGGVVVSIMWYFLLRRYQEILRFKYTQLQLFEEVLGLNTCGLVTAEDQFFRSRKPLGLPNCSTILQPPKNIKNFGITLAERNLALFLLVIYLLVLVIAIIGLF